MTRPEMRQKREQKLQEVKEVTSINQDTMHDVMDEATMHLVDHFDPDQADDRFKNDYCFIMGKTFLGVERSDPTKEVTLIHSFAHGDLHEFAHDLAEMMKQDREIARFIMHAVEVYGWRDPV